MFARRLLLGTIAVALLAALVIVPVPPAHADFLMNFVSASTNCQEGTFTFLVNQPQFAAPTYIQIAIPPNTIVEAVDSQGTLLGTKEYFILFIEVGGLFKGTIVYSQTPVGSVTFRLFHGGVATSPSAEGFAQQPSLMTLADTITIDGDCASAPGCDQLIPMDGAVMGLFTADAPAYSMLSEPVAPSVTIESGKTLYVFGQDASQQYYQVLLACTFLWVPKSTVGPDPEPLWHNTPLPTRIVQ